MNKEQKKEFIVEVKNILANTSVVVVAKYTGLTIAEMDLLRSSLRNEGGTIKAIKNRLTKIAIQETDAKVIENLLKGQLFIACSASPIIAPKILFEFAKKNEKLVILGGVMGDNLLGVEDIKALAYMPSLDDLRAKIIGLINAPATKIAMTMNAVAQKVALVIDAYSKKQNNS